MILRQFQPSDQPSIEAIQKESRLDLSARTPDGYFDDLSDISESFRGGAFFVAELERQVAGIGGLLPTGEIVRMRVAADFRRRGIATEILGKLVAGARNLKMDRVFLHTLEQQISAQALYTKFGFVEIGRGELYGNKVAVYEKRLSEADVQQNR